MKYEVPIYEKSNLTLEEASAYFNIGINKLREISDDDNCTFDACHNKKCNEIHFKIF